MGLFDSCLLARGSRRSPAQIVPLTPNSKQRGQILCSLSQTASFLFRNRYKHGTGISESRLIKRHGDGMDSNIKCKISNTERVWMWSELTQRNPPLQEALWVKNKTQITHYQFDFHEYENGFLFSSKITLKIIWSHFKIHFNYIPFSEHCHMTLKGEWYKISEFLNKSAFSKVSFLLWNK